MVQRGYTPLMYAAQNKSAQSSAVVKLFLGAKADINATDKVCVWEGNDVGCRMYGAAGRRIIARYFELRA